MGRSQTGPAHVPGTNKGEERAKKHGREPGRYEVESSSGGRPTGKSTARDYTSINPEPKNPIDPSSPTIPPA